jgi:hypothetical protein
MKKFNGDALNLRKILLCLEINVMLVKQNCLRKPFWLYLMVYNDIKLRKKIIILIQGSQIRTQVVIEERIAILKLKREMH